MEEINKREVAAIVVCYHPNLDDLTKMVYTLIPQVNHIYLIDNTDMKSNDEWNHKLLDQFHQVTYIPLLSNYGIGAAQNRGMEEAFANHHQYALILDQDSQIPDHLIMGLLDGIQKLRQQGKSIACIGPSVFNRDTHTEYSSKISRRKESANAYQEVSAIISSGSIIPKEAYEIIGGMDESLFIDNVDFEWCWRAKSKGYRTFLAKNVYMGHRVGQGNINILGLFSLQKPQPFRHYYQFRNTILLFRRKYTPKYFILRSIILKLVEFIVYSAFVKPRGLRARMMIKGIIHGILNKKGKLEL